MTIVSDGATRLDTLLASMDTRLDQRLLAAGMSNDDTILAVGLNRILADTWVFAANKSEIPARINRPVVEF